MEAFLASTLLSCKEWLKFFFQFFKKNEKELKSNQEEDGKLRRWKKEKQIIYKEMEKSDKDGWSL